MDHRALAETCLGQGNVPAAIAHALLALVDEFRDDAATDLPLSVWPET